MMEAKVEVHMEESPVLYRTEGPVAYITLNRPQYRNAQNSALAMLERLFASPAGCIKNGIMATSCSSICGTIMAWSRS